MNNNKHLSNSHLLDDLQGHTARSTTIVLLSQLVKFIAQIASIAVLARLLGPREFGLVAMVTIVTNLVAMFKDGGLSMATIQRESITHQQVSNLFWLNAATGVFLAILTILSAPVIALVYDEPILTNITLVISITFLIGGLSVQHDALLKRQMKFKLVALIDAGSLISGILTGITCAWLGMGYWSLVFMQLASSLMQTIIAWSVCQWRPAWPQRGHDTRPLIHYGLHLTGANFIGYLSSNITPFLVGHIGGPQQMGYFNRANTLASIPNTQILNPLISASTPALSLLASDQAKFTAAGLSLISRMSMLAMFVSVIMFVYADILIQVFLGPGWEEAIIYTRLLAIALLSEPTAAAMVVCVLASGHARLLMRVKLITFIVIVISIWIGKHWGTIGVVAGYASSAILVRLHIFLWIATKETRMPLFEVYKRLAQVLALGVLLITSLYGIRHVMVEQSIFSYANQLVISLALCSLYSMIFPRTRIEIISTLTIILKLFRIDIYKR